MIAQTQFAATVLEQLGGGDRFVAMTGARGFVASLTELRFSLPRGALRGINKVVVTLEANDTYTVQFWRLGRAAADVHMLHELSMVYGDGLRAVFEEHTGLRVSL